MGVDQRPASELVSGPDLGGGFLHQLSIDRIGEGTTFTHHAQDGGQDAGGPPRGPLDPLGFVHPPAPCMFGGPRCWHRRYLLPFSELPKVRFAYQRHRFVLETMIAQTCGDVPVPIGPAVRELVARVGPRLTDEGVPWFVGGSTAAWLLGAKIEPHDIDLATTRPGVDRVGELLAEYLIEPVAPTDWIPDRLVRGARAFVGTPKEGARVEWSVPLEPTPADEGSEFGGRPTSVRTLEVEVSGVRLRVSRPEYGLVRAAERGREKVVPTWAELTRRVGPDLPLLEALFLRSSLGASTKQNLRTSLGA